MRKTVAAPGIVLVVVLLLPLSNAGAIDLHGFWDDRCQECHGHAAAFARTHLKVDAGKLTGSHPDRDLRTFLGQHEMGPENAGQVYEMLLAQAQAKPLFQQKCSSCHGTAADFARKSLALQEGVLVGNKKRLPVSEFLKRHGKVAAADIPVLVESLMRVLTEVGGPRPD